MKISASSCSAEFKSQERPKRGLTLIEMFFLVGLVAVLCAILLPMLLHFRAKAGQEKCRENLRLLAQGTLLYESELGVFPSGFNWSVTPGQAISEASLASGHGPLVAVLGQVEQAALFHAVNFNWNIHSEANRTVCAARLELLLCPADDSISESAMLPNATFIGGSASTGTHVMTRSSYAAVAGPWVVNTWKVPGLGQNERSSFYEAKNAQLGVFNVQSQLKLEDIKDGASNTLLFGEHASDTLPEAKRLDAFWWVSGNHGDTLLTTVFPMNASKFQFNDEIAQISASSMHGSVVNFAFADGSARPLRDTIQSMPIKQPFRLESGKQPNIQGWLGEGVEADIVGPDPFWDTIFRLMPGRQFGVYQALSTRSGGERVTAD